MSGQMSLDNIARYAEQHNLNPQPQSGRQELLENLVNTYIFGLIFADHAPAGACIPPSIRCREIVFIGSCCVFCQWRKTTCLISAKEEG